MFHFNSKNTAIQWILLSKTNATTMYCINIFFHNIPLFILHYFILYYLDFVVKYDLGMFLWFTRIMDLCHNSNLSDTKQITGHGSTKQQPCARKQLPGTRKVQELCKGTKKVTHPSSHTVLEGNGLVLWLIMASRLPMIKCTQRKWMLNRQTANNNKTKGEYLSG